MFFSKNLKEYCSKKKFLGYTAFVLIALIPVVIIHKTSTRSRVPCNSQLFSVRTVTFDEQLEVTSPDSAEYRSADLMLCQDIKCATNL